MVVDPTEAKEIALEWLKLLGNKPTPPLMARTVKQVKGLMQVGFSDEEIRYTMEYVVRTNPNVYSFGYVEACINDVLRKRAEEKRKEESKQVSESLKKQKTAIVTSESEVTSDEEIRYTMEYVVRTNPNVYSFGYVEACINDVLRKRAEEKRKEESKQVSESLQKQTTAIVTSESEVTSDDESSERNRRKAKRFSVQSRLREKSYFNLFER